jgi:hypothetical protein
MNLGGKRNPQCPGLKVPSRSPLTPALSLLGCLLLLAAGCSTNPPHTGVLSLKIAGDPGVTVRVVPTGAGASEMATTVPATLLFAGGSYDLRCIHGSQRGRLSLSVARDNFFLAAGDTFQAGETILFEIRRNSISARLLSSSP